MALTQDQIVSIRRKVGNAPDDATLNEIYARNGESIDDLVLEVLETRLATLRATPDSFSVPGEYSQSTKEQMKQLEGLIASLGGSTEEGGVVRIVDPAMARHR